MANRGGFGPLADGELGFVSEGKPGDGFRVWSESRGLVASVDGLGPVDSLLLQSGPADTVLAWKREGNLAAQYWDPSTLAFETVPFDASPPVLDIISIGGELQSPGFVMTADTRNSGKETIMAFTYSDSGSAPVYGATSIAFDIAFNPLVAAFAQTPPAPTGGTFTVAALFEDEVQLVDENGAMIATSGYNSLEGLAQQLVCRSRAPTASGALCIIRESSTLEAFAWDGGSSLGPIYNLKDSSIDAGVTPSLATSLDVDRLPDGRFIALVDDQNGAVNLNLPDGTANVLLRVTDGEGTFTAAANLHVDGAICAQGLGRGSYVTPDHPVWERGSTPLSFVMTCGRSPELSDTLIRVTPDLSALTPL